MLSLFPCKVTHSRSDEYLVIWNTARCILPDAKALPYASGRPDLTLNQLFSPVPLDPGPKLKPIDRLDTEGGAELSLISQESENYLEGSDMLKQFYFVFLKKFSGQKVPRGPSPPSPHLDYGESK